MSEPSFYAWRKRLKTPSDVKPDHRMDCPQGSFIGLSLPTASAPRMEVVLSSGHTLRIPVGVDRQTLTVVLSALGEAGLC